METPRPASLGRSPKGTEPVSVVRAAGIGIPASRQSGKEGRNPSRQVEVRSRRTIKSLPIFIDFHQIFTYFIGMILVGTSGFQYRDWVPVFYPRDLDSRSWLRYYSQRFGCCELCFTSYRIPEALSIQEIMEETREALPLVFRAPSRLSEDHPENPDLAHRFAAALWPLKDAGQLAGILAQFPPKFEFMRDNFARLCLLRDSLEGIPLIAEFGCADWLTPRAAKHLAAAGIALACVDGGTSLKEKAFFCATAGLAYVRFQGRNQPRWLTGDGSAQHDYLYSRAELAAAIPEIRRLEQECERVLIFMNNPWRGQAIINARMLIDDFRLTIDDCKEPCLQSSIVSRQS